MSTGEAAWKGARPRHCGVEDRSERIDICGLGNDATVPSGLFRSHVPGSAQQVARAGQRTVRIGGIPLGREAFRQSEVGHEGTPRLVNQNVGRLQVAMQNPSRMGMRDGPADWQEELRGLARGERPLGDPAGQGRAMHELHAEVRLTFMVADFVDRHNVRMLKAGRRFGFSAESGQFGRRGELPTQNHFHGDGPIQADLPGFKHDSHAAAPQLATQFIIADPRGALRGAIGGSSNTESISERSCARSSVRSSVVQRSRMSSA